MQQVRSYRPIQNNESKLIAYSLLDEPTKYVSHFERYAASVVSVIAYGRRIASYLDPIITEVIWVMQIAAELNVPGKTFPMLMETFPILAKFPNWMAPWKRKATGRRRGKDFFYYLAKEANDESLHDNFSRDIFALQEKYDLEPREISAISGNLFGAGSDTSASTLCSFVLAAVMFPETVLKAQKEIDAVVGPDRSPDFDDLLKMPYVDAFVREVLRWRSVAIIGGQPHAPVQDDYYNGWLIPANTWVQGNLWCMPR
jgi:cytochrome P450